VKTADENFNDDTYLARLLANVEKTESCWIWTGLRSGHGPHMYGRISFRGKNSIAHRVSWMLFRGEIPQGLSVCHRCDVPLCINPDHLFLGTHAANMHDMRSKGRGRTGTALRRADGLPSSAKLTKDQIAQIKELRSTGLTQQRIASIIGVSQGCISQLLRGATNYANRP